MYAQLRRGVEYLYQDYCDIARVVEVFDSETKQTRGGWQTVVSHQPCRISFSTVVPAGSVNDVATVSQTIKLFIAPELDIPAGSRITVTRNGKAVEYKASGVPAVYNSHQEVLLLLLEDYA